MYHAFSKTSPFGMQQQILTVLRSVMTSGSTGVSGSCSFTVMTCDAWRNGRISEKIRKTKDNFSWPIGLNIRFCSSTCSEMKSSKNTFSLHAWDPSLSQVSTIIALIFDTLWKKEMISAWPDYTISPTHHSSHLLFFRSDKWVIPGGYWI